MSERPEWRKCIRRPEADRRHQSWCGRGDLPLLDGLEHAVLLALTGARQRACRSCVARACEALRSAT